MHKSFLACKNTFHVTKNFSNILSMFAEWQRHKINVRRSSNVNLFQKPHIHIGRFYTWVNCMQKCWFDRMFKFKCRCQMQNASAHLTFYLILLNQQTNEPNSLLKRSILISMFNAFNYQLIIYSFQPDIFIFFIELCWKKLFTWSQVRKYNFFFSPSFKLLLI